MEIKFSGPFEKDLRAVHNRGLILKVDDIIRQLRAASSLSQVPGIKQLHGHKNCYRIRTGNYRLGLVVEGKIVWLARFMDRKDIYKFFP